MSALRKVRVTLPKKVAELSALSVCCQRKERWSHLRRVQVDCNAHHKSQVRQACHGLCRAHLINDTIPQKWTAPCELVPIVHDNMGQGPGRVRGLRPVYRSQHDRPLTTAERTRAQESTINIAQLTTSASQAKLAQAIVE